MLNRRFLGTLIDEAARIWSVEPVSLYSRSSDRAARARLAVFHIAYSIGFTTDDLCGAFRWSRMRNGYFRQTVVKRHEEWRDDEEYHRLYATLESHARASRQASQGYGRADD